MRRQRQAAPLGHRPTQPRRQPDHVAGILFPLGANGFAFHELPEARDVLLKLPVHDVRAVQAEIPQRLRRVIGIVERRQDRTGVELRGHDRRRWQDPVVVRVPEDELAGGDALAADPGNRRLRDAVVKSERLVIAVGTISALHGPGQLNDAACRVFDDVRCAWHTLSSSAAEAAWMRTTA